MNRESDLAHLDTFLTARAAEVEHDGAAVISTVAGAAGIGKTSLALRWAHRVRHLFPDGDLYVDLRGHSAIPPARPAQVLEDFLRAMNVPAGKMPSTVESMSALFRSLLAGRKLLILLDNAASPDQVRPFLPGSSQSVVVVTSRSRLKGLVVREGATRVTLDALSQADSLVLLREIIGYDRVDRELEAATEIIEFCAFLPLALRIVADRAVLRSNESLRSLADELITESSLLDAFSGDDDDLSEVRTVLSWSYKSLRPDAMRLFALLSEHPGNDISVESAAAVGALDERKARSILESIQSLHMIERVGADRYRLHDLIKAYAAERVEEEWDLSQRTEATRRLLAWYLARAHSSYRVILPQGRAIDVGELAETFGIDAFADVSEALAWCDQERRNVLACVTLAEARGEFEYSWKLAISLMGYLERRSYWTDWISSHDVAIRAAHTIGDQKAEAFALMLQGDAFWDRRQFTEALNRYERAIEVGRSAEDLWAEGFALRGCGLAYQELGDYQKAVEYSTAALPIFRRIGELRGQGMTYLSLGNAYRGLRDLASAISFYESAIEMFSALGNEWSVGLAKYHSGVTHVLGARHTAALAAFRQAHHIFRSMGDLRHEAWVLRDMAPSLKAVGLADEAQDAMGRALEIFLDLDDPEADALRRQVEAG